jgi:hypothetical protein
MVVPIGCEKKYSGLKGEKVFGTILIASKFVKIY